MNKYDELIKSLMEDKLYLPVLKMFAEYRFQTNLFQSLIRLTEQESMLKRHHRPYLHMREKIDTLCHFAKEVFDMNASEREEKLPELKDVIDNYIENPVFSMGFMADFLPVI